MGRTLDDVIGALPKKRRQRVEARAEELKQEVESLAELRRVAGKAQAEIASTLKIKQPSVSKIEKQTDMYLSTLKSYVEAVGGQLDLVVRFPSRPPLHIESLGEMMAKKNEESAKTSARTGARPGTKSRRPG